MPFVKFSRPSALCRFWRVGVGRWDCEKIARRLRNIVKMVGICAFLSYIPVAAVGVIPSMLVFSRLFPLAAIAYFSRGYLYFLGVIGGFGGVCGGVGMGGAVGVGAAAGARSGEGAPAYVCTPNRRYTHDSAPLTRLRHLPRNLARLPRLALLHPSTFVWRDPRGYGGWAHPRRLCAAGRVRASPEG